MDGDKFINGLQSLTDKAIEAANAVNGKPVDKVSYVTFDMEEVIVEYDIFKGDYPDETAERFKLEDIVYKTVGEITKERKEEEQKRLAKIKRELEKQKELEAKRKEKAERALYEKLRKKYEST